MRDDHLSSFYHLQLQFSGYSHKQKVLIEKVLDHLFDFKIDPQRFEILKEEFRLLLKNFVADQPYQHSLYYLALILVENAWSKSELEAAIKCKIFSNQYLILAR